MNSPVSARSKIYRIALDAVLLALFVVFSMVPSELSWASLPVLLAAFLLSPADAIAIAVCGSFIEQMGYGVNFYTLIWMLPWAVFAAFVGFAAVWVRRSPRIWKMTLVIVVAELLLNVGNTSAMLFCGWTSIDPSRFTPGLPLWIVTVLTYIVRMPQAIVRAILSSVVLPLLLPPLRKVMARMQ